MATASRPSELVSPAPELGGGRSRPGGGPTSAPSSPRCWRAPVLVLRTVAAVGVTGMVPTTILLDEEGPAPARFHPAERRPCGSGDRGSARQVIDPGEFFARTGGSINQQSVAPKLRWLARHEPECLSRAKTLLGSYDYVTACLTGSPSVEQELGARGGFHGPGPGLPARGADPPGRHHVPSTCRRFALSHEGGGRSDGARRRTRPALPPVLRSSPAAPTTSPRPSWAGAAEDGDLVVKFGGAGDIMLSCREAVTDPRMFIDFHIVPGLHFSNGCMAASGSMLNWIVRHLARAEAEEARERRVRESHARLDRRAEGDPAGRRWSRAPALLPRREDAAPRPPRPGHGGPAWDSTTDCPTCGGPPSKRSPAASATMWPSSPRWGSSPRRVIACDGGAASDLWLRITADVLEQADPAPPAPPGLLSRCGPSSPAWGHRGRSTTGARSAHYVQPGSEYSSRMPSRLPVIPGCLCASIATFTCRLQSLYPRLAEPCRRHEGRTNAPFRSRHMSQGVRRSGDRRGAGRRCRGLRPRAGGAGASRCSTKRTATLPGKPRQLRSGVGAGQGSRATRVRAVVARPRRSAGSSWRTRSSEDCGHIAAPIVRPGGSDAWRCPTASSDALDCDARRSPARGGQRRVRVRDARLPPAYPRAVAGLRGRRSPGAPTPPTTATPIR